MHVSFITSQYCTVVTILIFCIANNHSSQVWHFKTVMRAEIKFMLAHHHTLRAAAAVKLFMINASMILLPCSLSSMLMMWFNVPVLFKRFIFDIHPGWSYFFHSIFKIYVNIANPENSLKYLLFQDFFYVLMPSVTCKLIFFKLLALMFFVFKNVKLSSLKVCV